MKDGLVSPEVFRRLKEDPRIGPLHLSLYLAICSLRPDSADIVRVSARTLMPLAKIAGKTPYHRTILELAAFGYIRYKPSYDPARPSLVWLIDASVSMPANGRSGGVSSGSAR